MITDLLLSQDCGLKAKSRGHWCTWKVTK